MMKSKLLHLIILLTLVITDAAARVEGRITDENDKGIEGAQVVAFDADSIIIETAHSNELGLFVIGNDNARTLNVTAFGFVQKSVGVDDTGGVIQISMENAGKSLDEVVVNARRPAARIEGNALALTISGTYLARTGTADDLLGKLPTVSGRDGQFQVFGRGTPEIYINGRKMTDATELYRISADNIRDVRIISNPGPKYKSGVRAVIEIRTKKPVGDGFGTSLRLAGRFDRYFSPTSTVDVSYRSGGLDLSLSGMFWKDTRKFGTSSSQDSYTAPEAPANTLSMEQDVKNTSRNFLSSFRVNYQFNDNHSVGAYFTPFWAKADIRFLNFSDLLEGGNLTNSISNDGSMLTRSYPTINANLYYSGRIRNVSIDYNADFYNTHPETTSLHHEEGDLPGDDRTVSSWSRFSARMWAQKIVAGWNAGPSSADMGMEYTDSRVAMDYQNPEDIVPSGSYLVKERNAAAFAQYAHNFGNLLKLSAGLRYEHVTYDYADKADAGEGQGKTYDNLFPSAMASSQIGALSLSLSFSSSMRRPSYQSLDENLTYVNRFIYKKGNRMLKPTTRHTLELMASYNPWFLRASFTHTKNPVISETSVMDDEQHINLLSYVNGRGYNSLDVTAGASFGGEKWDLQLNAGIEKQWFKMNYLDRPLSLSNPRGVLKGSGSVRLPLGILLMADYTFRTRGNSENLSMRSSSVLNLTLYRTFLKNKLVMWISGNDLLDGQSDRFTEYSDRVVFRTHERMYMRSLQITLRYNFNVPKSKYKGSGAGNNEKSRM